MAKVILLGAALLGYLVVLVHSDRTCDVHIERTALTNSSRIGLHCVVTGDMSTIAWASNTPMSPTLPRRLLVDLPVKKAKGVFQCHVQCGKTVRIAYLKLDSSDQKNPGMNTGSAVVLSLGLVLLTMILLHIGYSCRRRYVRRRAARIRAGALATNGFAMQ